MPAVIFIMLAHVGYQFHSCNSKQRICNDSPRQPLHVNLSFIDEIYLCFSNPIIINMKGRCAIEGYLMKIQHIYHASFHLVVCDRAFHCQEMQTWRGALVPRHKALPKAFPSFIPKISRNGTCNKLHCGKTTMEIAFLQQWKPMFLPFLIWPAHCLFANR